VVAQDHRIARAQIGDQPLAFIQIGRNALIVVIGDVVTGDHRGLRVRQQSELHRTHRLAMRGMQMHHGRGVLPRHVDRRMDREPGRVDGMAARSDRRAVDVDLDQARRGDLLEHHVVGVDQEMMLRPRHACRQMREDQIVPAVKGDQPIGGGKVDARLPFAWAHRRRP
jgi:hypothetical protein